MTTSLSRTVTALAAVAALAFLANGCSSDGTTTSDSTSSDSTSSDSTTSDSTTSDSTSTTGTSGPPQGSTDTVFAAGDIDPALQAFIDLAVADLAGRLGIDDSEITTRSAVLVVWPDSALGCPEKGMQYAQVLSDGTLIELESGGRNYRYHAGESTTPFLCEQPLAATPSTLA